MTNEMQFGSDMHGGDTSTTHLALRSMMEVTEVQAGKERPLTSCSWMSPQLPQA